MNRLTITLDDDLYAMARAHAISSKKSLSKAIGDLLRQRTASGAAAPRPLQPDDAASYFDPVLGIQVSRCPKPLTEQDIQGAIDDEDARHLEMMGLGPEEIERSLAQ